MSSKILEIEEKTIDGAIEKACRDFGVPREKLNIEIISEGSNGFLGLGAKKAKIRASLLSLDMDFSLSSHAGGIKAEPPRAAKPEPRPAAPAPEAKPEVRSAQRKAEAKPQTKPQTKPEPARDQKPDNKADIKIESRRENSTSPEPRAPKHRPAAQPHRPHVPRPAPEMKPAAAEDTADMTPKPPALTIPTLAAVEATTPAALKARELLVGILAQMTFDCQVKAMETDDTIILGISGDESGLLIGRRGQNLDAIQYILNKAINKSDADRKMIVVDSEDYRKRRQESLLIMAERIRDKVKKTQKPLSLSHMNAHDRRIIHLALQEDETLVTKSRGEGEFRKVIVLPAKSRNGGGNSRARNRQ